MAPLGLSALKSLLGRGSKSKGWQPPEASWSRPFGLGWENPTLLLAPFFLEGGRLTAFVAILDLVHHQASVFLLR